jgi:hypothetical protein
MKGLEGESRNHNREEVGAKWLREKENIFLSATDEPKSFTSQDRQLDEGSR